MITQFLEIGLGGKKRFRCSCGKRVARQRRFWQTLNPYNLNEKGNPKTHGQIMAECRAALVKWQQRQEPCEHPCSRPIGQENQFDHYQA